MEDLCNCAIQLPTCDQGLRGFTPGKPLETFVRLSQRHCIGVRADLASNWWCFEKAPNRTLTQRLLCRRLGVEPIKTRLLCKATPHLGALVEKFIAAGGLFQSAKFVLWIGSTGWLSLVVEPNLTSVVLFGAGRKNLLKGPSYFSSANPQAFSSVQRAHQTRRCTIYVFSSLLGCCRLHLLF
jgi:hypothetical protein